MRCNQLKFIKKISKTTPPEDVMEIRAQPEFSSPIMWLTGKEKTNIETDMELAAIFFVLLSLTLSPLSCCQSEDRELSRETLSYLISYESLSQLDTLDEKHKPKPYNISTPCRAFLTELSKHGSEFIRCSIDKSRPFRLCMSCGQSYTKTMRTFDDIQEVMYLVRWKCADMIHKIKEQTNIFPHVTIFRRISLIIPLQQCWRGYSNAAVRVWLGEWIRASLRVCILLSVALCLVQMLLAPYIDYSFCPNFKVNFGSLCIKPCGHDTDYSFCPITFKLPM